MTTLSQLRDTRNLSAREVARRMKTSHGIVLRFEKRGTAALETAEAYADAIEMPFHRVHDAALETRKPANPA